MLEMILLLRRLFVLLALVFTLPALSMEGHEHHQMSGMTMDATGMVMGSNSDQLPEDCEEISEDYKISVAAGIRYAEPFPGTVFGFSQHAWQVKPCSRITVTLKNEDEVRHQWMLHGLPKYLYDQGMFHMEAAGGQSQTGTFIVPSDDKTYLVHCDIAQHMEKGMKAQLVVGSGGDDLWSIPGVTAYFERPLVGVAKLGSGFFLFVGLIFALIVAATVKFFTRN